VIRVVLVVVRRRRKRMGSRGDKKQRKG